MPARAPRTYSDDRTLAWKSGLRRREKSVAMAEPVVGQQADPLLEGERGLPEILQKVGAVGRIIRSRARLIVDWIRHDRPVLSAEYSHRAGHMEGRGHKEPHL